MSYFIVRIFAAIGVSYVIITFVILIWAIVNDIVELKHDKELKRLNKHILDVYCKPYNVPIDVKKCAFNMLNHHYPVEKVFKFIQACGVINEE